MDPFGHPDLDRLGRSLRHALDETLNAEQDAARAAAIRRRTLRDRFMESEDRTELVRVGLVDGHMVGGLVTGVGVDHVILLDDGVERFVSLAHVVSMERR